MKLNKYVTCTLAWVEYFSLYIQNIYLLQITV